jgi:hypothetical protein
MEDIDDIKNFISTKQKGYITENRASEIITLSSNGRLTCYTPNSDDDGIDLIVNPKGTFNPLFIQVKSRFKLQKTGQFIQNVQEKTFVADKIFYLLLIYFNKETLEIDKLWLLPSLEFQDIAYKQKSGKRYKSFYRFSANPRSNKDKWSMFIVDKADLGKEILHLINGLYNISPQ